MTLLTSFFAIDDVRRRQSNQRSESVSYFNEEPVDHEIVDNTKLAKRLKQRRIRSFSFHSVTLISDTTKQNKLRIEKSDKSILREQQKSPSEDKSNNLLGFYDILNLKIVYREI